jgi:hypothetical protein
MTNWPSGVIMTPGPTGPSSVFSMVFKKLLGMPVVRLILGLLSNSLSLLVGQSCIQWPDRK